MSLVPPEAIPGLDQKTRRAGCRFRPPLRRTFGFRLEPTGEASVYSRPVLGARRTLKGAAPSVQGPAKTLSRKERGFLSAQLETHPPAGLFDPLDADADAVAEPVGEAGPAADERGREGVELEVVARKLPRGDIALEYSVEAHKNARADRSDDLPIELRVPPFFEKAALEQPGEADLVRLVLDRRELALANRRPLGELLELVRERLVRGPELAEERAVHDEVRVAADRRGEVTVGLAKQARSDRGSEGR